jgi:MFS family permease
VRALRVRLAESLAALRDVFRNRDLRRLELAAVGAVAGRWSYLVGLAVYAYGSGGAAAVGLVGLLRMLPSALAAPFTSLLGDRLSRVRVMLASDLVRATALSFAAAVAISGGPSAVVYAMAVIVSVTGTAFRPAEAALVPTLARSPEELTAANVASSAIESVGAFAGPAIAGLILALWDPGAVFAATAATFLWSALMVSGINAPAQEERRTDAAGGIVDEVLGGVRAIAGDARLRLIVGLFGAQTLVAGALDVLIVVTALRLLHIGQSGVGLLESALGVGGLVGAAVALALVGRRRLAADFGLGIVLWGAPIALLGLWPTTAGAAVFLAVVGAGNTVTDVAGFTLLQRVVDDRLLARAFGALDSVFLITLGIGAAIAPVLVSALGSRGALVAAGVLLPVLAALSWPRLRRIDASATAPAELDLLRGVPLFAPLPAAALEHLSSGLRHERFGAGDTIVSQGDVAGAFYVLQSGEVDVVVDGRPAAVLGPRDCFGEIALLREARRTATVTARTDVDALVLDGDDFVAAVTGHPPSADAAEEVIAARLATAAPSALRV